MDDSSPGLNVHSNVRWQLMFGEVTRGLSGTSSVTLLFLFILREIWLSEEYLVFPGCGVGKPCHSRSERDPPLRVLDSRKSWTFAENIKVYC